jgi:hypothetical protein
MTQCNYRVRLDLECLVLKLSAGVSLSRDRGGENGHDSHRVRFSGRRIITSTGYSFDTPFFITNVGIDFDY